MAKIPAVDYSSKDAEALFNDALETIPVICKDWTDHNDSDFGIALLHLFSNYVDGLHYYGDRILNEKSLATAVTRKSVIDLLEIFDYKLHRTVASTADIVFTLGSIQTDNTVIKSGAVISNTITSEGNVPLKFEVVEDLIIPAGLLGNETVFDVVLTTSQLPLLPDPILPLNSVIYVETDDAYFRVTSTDTWEELAAVVHSPISIGDYVFYVSAEEGTTVERTYPKAEGIPFEEYVIPEIPVIERSTVVYVDIGGGYEEWSEVNSWVDAEPTQKVYTLVTDENDIVKVIFGDDLQGRKLHTGDIVKIVYRKGGGLVGNIGANTINKITDTSLISWESDFNVKVPSSCNNPAQASGGEDRETIAEAKLNGPRSFKTMGVAITPADFKTIAEAVPGVDRCYVIEGSNNIREYYNGYNIPTGCSGCTIALAITPVGGGTISDALKTRVEETFEGITPPCTTVIVTSAINVGISITGIVYGYSNYTGEDISQDLTVLLSEFFSLAEGDINLGDIYAAVEGVSGVHHVDLLEMTRLPKAVYEIRSGDWNVTNFRVGEDSTYESFTATFTSDTDFNVTGSSSGVNTPGSLGSYTTDGGEVSFNVTGGANPAKVGDTFKFETSPKVGNVILEGPNAPVQGNISLPVVTLAEEEGTTCG